MATGRVARSDYKDATETLQRRYSNAIVTAMRDFLDGPLFYLGREVRGVFDMLMVRQGNTKAVLLFSSEAQAAAHKAGRLKVLRVFKLAADDLRAKEEFCLAALAQGARTLWLDTAPGALKPKTHRDLHRALAYVRSFKNDTACL